MAFIANNINVMNAIINDIHVQSRRRIRRRRCLLRTENMAGAMEMPDEAFRRTYRLTKPTFKHIYNIMRPHLTEGRRLGSVTARTKVIIN